MAHLALPCPLVCVSTTEGPGRIWLYAGTCEREVESHGCGGEVLTGVPRDPTPDLPAVAVIFMVIVTVILLMSLLLLLPPS